MTTVWLSMRTLRANLVCKFPDLRARQVFEIGTIAPLKLSYYSKICPDIDADF